MKRASFAHRHLLNRSHLSYLLYPVSLCYAGYMLFRRKYLFRKPYRPSFKVISIGNLTSGGSGKTPISIALAKALSEKGFRVAYSSRGYKSMLEKGAHLIFKEGKLLVENSIAGDEALMAAALLGGIPVFCGKDRILVAKKAEELKPDVLILDDGFQHLKIARDLDLVVFDSSVALGNGFVLPAGYLREPLSAIKGDALAVVHQKPTAEWNVALEKKLEEAGKRVYKVQSVVGNLVYKGQKVGREFLEGKTVTLLSGIAMPHSFEASVKAKGISWEEHLAMKDHQDYASKMLGLRLDGLKTDYILTTAKDAVKLQGRYDDKLLVLQMETKLSEELIDKALSVLS